MAIGTCENCGNTYERPPSLLGSYCSPRCAYDHRSTKRPRKHRQMRIAPTHPLAPPGGYISEARIVLYAKIGSGPHPCHWCSRAVDWTVGQRGNLRDALVADHVNSDPLDDRPENLVPACGTCNGERARTVTDAESFATRSNGTRLRVGEQRTCRHCGATFTTTPSLRNYCTTHKRPSTRT